MMFHYIICDRALLPLVKAPTGQAPLS
jgi:hypothetical protein